MIWKILICSLALTDFKAANELFDAGKFPEAAAAYEKLEPKSAHVYFNLGNAYYRAGQLGRAVLNYERARSIAPGDPDILANLKFTEEKLNVTEVTTPRYYVRSLVESRTVAQWSRYEIAGIWLTVLLAGAAIWWPRWRSGLVILTVVVGVGWGGAVGALVYRKTLPPTAVVISARTPARFAPQPEATVHFQLGEGAKVGVLEARGSWTFVERADGQTGWISSDSIENVNNR